MTEECYPSTSKPSFDGAPYFTVDSDDEIDTIDMEASEDGSTVNESLGKMKKHPQERRQKSERIATYVLVGFLGVMFLALIPLSRQHLRENTTYLGDGTKPLEDQADISSDSTQGETNQTSTLVYCNGKIGFTLPEWLHQDVEASASLCDPEFHPERSQDADVTKTVKVFIMMGEANMVGAGQVHGNVEGTLDFTVRDKKRFTHLIDYNKNWRPRSDVRYVAVNDDFVVQRNGWLAAHEDYNYFGPELQFGYIMGELSDEPVLLIKSCSGHNTIGGDLLPPGSKQYDFDGYTYAGYGESPRRWKTGARPVPNSWYAGSDYDMDTSNARKVLRNIGKYYPGATSYRVEGFVIWQGESDRRDPAYVAKYEENMKNLIDNLRVDFNAPEAKFSIATIGQRGEEMTGASLRVVEAQLAIGSDKYAAYEGNVATVDIRSSWRGPFQPGFGGDYTHRDPAHYGNNAETVMETGNALGLAMAKLLYGT